MATSKSPNARLQMLVSRSIDVFDALPTGFIDQVEAVAKPRNIRLHIGPIIDSPDLVSKRVLEIALEKLDPCNITEDAQGNTECILKDKTRLHIIKPEHTFPQLVPLLAPKQHRLGYNTPLLLSGKAFVGRIPLPLHRVRISAPGPASMQQALVEATYEATKRAELFRAAGLLATDFTYQDYYPATVTSPPKVMWHDTDDLGRSRLEITVNDYSPEGLAEQHEVQRLRLSFTDSFCR